MNMRKPGQGRVFLSCGRPGVLRGLLLPLLLLGALCAYAPEALAATAAHQPAQKGKALHGQSWAFGQSEDRKAAIWRRGVPAQSLKQRALTGTGAKAQSGKAAAKGSKSAAAGTSGAAKGASQKSAAKKSAPGHGAMDTESGIDRALAAAQAMADAEAAEAAKGQHAKPKGSLGMSMKNSTTTWNVTPMREAMRPDEVLVRDRHHVLRAFADVEPTEDLSIRVGPELILKDEQHGAESAGSSQPDSALGLGMQFKLDF
ncbi:MULTISPECIES: hypothetical protein [unclassified Desulfovibrio]|uniref:hypothetical protein n=1 Tax=unclassified Desulfovibrio TaxID=2593640 RepID=UPI0013EBCC43|nr:MULTISPECIES: hypothetical protein [unclassified Desulfovibrio]